MFDYNESEKNIRDSQATDYEHWYTSQKGFAFDQLEKKVFENNIKQGKYKNALEIGCGTGRITVSVSKLVDKITAVDISKNSLDILRSKNLINVKLLQADCRFDFPFAKDEKFDLVFSCQVFQHWQLNDIINFFTNIKKFLTPNGVIIFSVYNFDYFKFHSIPEILENGLYSKRFNKNYIRYLARKCKYDITRISYYKSLPNSFYKKNEKYAHLIITIDQKICMLKPLVRFFNFMLCNFKIA